MSLDQLIIELRKNRKDIIAILDFVQARNLLTKRERDILYMRLIDWWSLEQVAKQVGVTRERIRQIEAKALEIVRCYFR